MSESNNWPSLNDMDNAFTKILLWGVVLVVFALYLRSAGTHDQVDFGVYRAGGKAILSGSDLYALRAPHSGLPFTYPPASAALFALLAWMPLRFGQVLWMATSLVALCLLVRLTLRRYAGGIASTSTTVMLIVLIVVARSDVVQVNLNFGQINVLIGLLAVADLCDVLPRVPRGVMIGIAAALKLTPLFLVAYFVAVRRYRAAAAVACTFAAVSALAVLCAPRASTEYWLHGYFADPRRTGGIAYISNQSLNGVIIRLSGSVEHARIYWLPTAIITALAILWAVRQVHERRPWLAEAMALAAMLLLSPVSWVHHWILALPLLVGGFRLAAQPKHRRLLLLLLSALSATLWFGVIWHVPNTQNREFHHNTWQFLVGNSDVLLLLATIATVALASNANDPDIAVRTTGVIHSRAVMPPSTMNSEPVE